MVLLLKIQRTVVSIPTSIAEHTFSNTDAQCSQFLNRTKTSTQGYSNEDIKTELIQNKMCLSEKLKH